MANASQIKALVTSHAEGDDAKFYSVAMQVAAHAARSGHSRFAQELRDVIDEAKQLKGSIFNAKDSGPVPLGKPRGELAGLIDVSYPKLRLADISLDPTVQSALQRIVVEQRQRAQLHEYGYAPIRKVLLIGPPGTGKTTTGAALSYELGIPLFTVQLDGLITKYLGETSAKLRLVFDAIESNRGVYLFDEFDALGGDRAATNDVGEIRRVLNSFLLFLDRHESDSLVVAATNHAQLLDRALFRRFDAVIEYTLPSEQIAADIMRSRLAVMNTDAIDWEAAARASAGLSQAEIVWACDRVAKTAILSSSNEVSEGDLLEALTSRANGF